MLLQQFTVCELQWCCIGNYKKGKKNEKVSINVNGYYGWQNLTRFPELANAEQYTRGLAEAAQNRGEDPNSVYTKKNWLNGLLEQKRAIKAMIIMT